MRRGSKWFYGLTAVSLSVGLAVLPAAGSVSSDSGFEAADGNLAVDSTFDWNGFSPTSWTGAAPYRVSEGVVSGWTFAGIEDAQATTSDTAFAGGTKQDDACPTVRTGKAPNKDDLKRIYLSTKVVNGNTFLNLAWVRIPQNSTSASAHVAFEFNKGTDGPCGGSSDGLVKRVAGDMLVVYDFEGGSAAPSIKLARWTTTSGDACDVSSHTPPCWGTATDLTSSGYAEAEVNVGTTVTDAIGPDGSESLADSEFGEAGIDLTGAGVFTAGTCESFGTAFGVSRSSGNSGTAQMKDLVGPADFTLANCGTVIIHKVTDPTGDTTTDFGFTTNVTTTPSTTPSPFSLKDGGTKTITNVNPGSSLNVTESDPGTNYVLQGIDCSASTVPAANYSTDTTTRAVTFSIGAGETLECTFTNKLQLGAITISKTDSKTKAALGGAVFGIKDSAGQTVATVTTSGEEGAGKGKVCTDGLPFGDYTVTETSAPTGYAIDDATGHIVTVNTNAKCTDTTYGGASISFTDTPTANIQVNFADGGSGVTSAKIDCGSPGGSSDTTAASGWDASLTITGIKAPTTVTCTITIDP